MGRSLALTQPRPSLAMAKLRHNAQKMTGAQSERIPLFFGQTRPETLPVALGFPEWQMLSKRDKRPHRAQKKL
jgi:hypothetical protein